jgi:hypothetical protein
MNVERTRVGSVLSLERRPVTVSLDEKYEEIGIRSFGRGVFHKEPVSGAALGSKRVFWIEPGDLLLSNVFAWEGAIAVAAEADRGRIGSHRFMTYTPTDDRIDTAWASWYFRSDPGIELIRQASPGSAGRNRTLAIERFEAIEIPLPPLGEQRRVAARLDRIAGILARTTDLAARAAALSKAVNASIALRPDLEDEAKAIAGWRWMALGDLLEPSGVPTVVEPTNRYRIAGIYSFGRGLINRGPIAGAETAYSRLAMIRTGEIVVSKLNGWEGAIAVVPEEFDGYYVSSEYPVFSVRSELLSSEYFVNVASSRVLWDSLNSSARGSMVRRRRISPTQFLAAHIWVPPMQVQLDVVRTLRRTGRVGNLRNAATERVNALIPAALNAAFTS